MLTHNLQSQHYIQNQFLRHRGDVCFSHCSFIRSLKKSLRIPPAASGQEPGKGSSWTRARTTWAAAPRQWLPHKEQAGHQQHPFGPGRLLRQSHQRKRHSERWGGGLPQARRQGSPTKDIEIQFRAEGSWGPQRLTQLKSRPARMGSPSWCGGTSVPSNARPAIPGQGTLLKRRRVTSPWTVILEMPTALISALSSRREFSVPGKATSVVNEGAFMRAESHGKS